MRNAHLEAAPALGAGLPLFRPFSTLNEVEPEPEWLWEGFLAVGQLSMLVARPFAGKSTLLFGLLSALKNGDPFLGRRTSRSTAVLLTEENNQQLREKAIRFGVLDADHRYLGRSDRVLRSNWHALIDRATEHALGEGHRLLVVDPFATLAGLEPEEENDSGAIIKRLRPLVDAAGQGLAVLFLHHTNKIGGIRGSQAFAATVDIDIRLARPKKRSTFTLDTERRTAKGMPAELTAQLHRSPDGWFFTNSTDKQPAASANTHDTAHLLEAALLAAGPRGLTYQEIDETPGLSKHKAKKRLPKWEAENRVRRHGSGKKGDPNRWISTSFAEPLPVERR